MEYFSCYIIIGRIIDIIICKKNYSQIYNIVFVQLRLFKNRKFLFVLKRNIRNLNEYVFLLFSC